MPNTPPHLPPKSCNLQVHRTRKTLPALLFFVLVSALTSVALTLTTVVWFVPTFTPEQMVTKIQKNKQEQKVELDIGVLNKTRQLVWNIYDKRQKIDNKYYRSSTEVLQAVMFSSDGWAVVYDADYKKGEEKNWEGVDYQGTIYKIEKVFVDPVSKLNYVKFAGEGFPFVSFVNWKDLGEGDVVWEVSLSDYKQQVLEKQINVSNIQTYSIWQQQYFYHLPNVIDGGSLIINEKGDLVGIVNENGNIIESWMVENQYSSVLKDGVPNYTAVAWKGYMVYGHTREEDYTKRISGFYIASSPTFITSSSVGQGDLIIRIQDRQVKASTLAREILLAPEKFNVTVLRNNVEIDIMVKKASVVK